MERLLERMVRLEAAQRQLAVQLRFWRGAAAGLLALGLAVGALALSPPLVMGRQHVDELFGKLADVLQRLA